MVDMFVVPSGTAGEQGARLMAATGGRWRAAP